MKQYERRVYSQNGEDGILAHIFDKIGVTNKVAVEFGVSANGGGLETNTRHLAEQGWKTFWFDGAPADNLPPNCTFTQRMLMPWNIAETFQEAGVPQKFDLLSIDVDGNDYYLREALINYEPRVCVMEYNGAFTPDVDYIMPFNETYSWRLWDTNFGASLLAYTNQASRLGYDLIYCDSKGVNAFFIRRDVNLFESKTPAEAWVQLWWTKYYGA